MPMNIAAMSSKILRRLPFGGFAAAVSVFAFMVLL
jgi:hypothetical protein